LGVAVVKVTPSVGSVKYKAQHVVLAVRIPVLIGGKWPGGAENGGFCCGFSRKGAKFVGFAWGVYWSVIGHRLRVGAEEGKGKAQEGCRLCE
jgi:hypothetical protein